MPLAPRERSSPLRSIGMQRPRDARNVSGRDASRLIARFGPKPPHQIIPIELQQSGRIFAIAGISGSLATALNANLLDQPLDALRPVSRRKLADERLKIF